MVRFSKASLTYHVIVTAHGCCPGMLVVVVINQLVPLKLYGLVCNPTPMSDAFIIVKVQIAHSSHELLLNVNVGPCLSILIADEVLIGSSFPSLSTL
ncbi:MAG: hypothetical protein BWY04_00216 [candidate division CPR1 bacterium ADurb.Bin160]|jgi:hypothetical protein|uniref:Uncharacterized protein n=1 Tax=candidate division CPR1 bacterium ADurb.Bin160 TaxID=1852826 RepID=A0A1V5ZR19_9BACT|nr:MAG: hypothetical protein BWY04_00216 [candidate division CPR1 bacterium ADurb.Bin160]